MSRKFLVTAVATAVGLSLQIGDAQAGTYAFDFVGGPFTIQGHLLTSNTLNAIKGYDVTGISGTLLGPGGGAISGLVPNPNQPLAFNNGSWIYDNVLFPAANPVVDNPGILFTAGSSDYNVFSSGSAYLVSTLNPAGVWSPGTVGTFSVTAAPEPSTWAMFVLGLAGLGFMSRRKKAHPRIPSVSFLG